MSYTPRKRTRASASTADFVANRLLNHLSSIHLPVSESLSEEIERIDIADQDDQIMSEVNVDFDEFDATEDVLEEAEEGKYKCGDD